VALVPDARWLSVIVGSLVAMGGALLSDDLGWHPPGPLFLVFAFAACAAIPGSASTVAIAAAVAAGSALFARDRRRIECSGRLDNAAVRTSTARLSDHASPSGEVPHLLRYFLASGPREVISQCSGMGACLLAMVGGRGADGRERYRWPAGYGQSRLAGTWKVSCSRTITALHAQGARPS